MRAIGKLAEEKGLIIVSDEVYDSMAWDRPHVRVASLDDNRFFNRTLTIGSAGKSFAATGLRVGWACGPAALIKPTVAASTRIVFCANGTAQAAVAVGFEKSSEHQFFEIQREEYIERRKVMMEALDLLGLPYTIPEGGYFILLNVAGLQLPVDFTVPEIIKGRTRDWAVAWFIAQEAGVVTIPPTDFYSPEHADLGADHVRIAFCKDTDTLRAAGKRLLKLKPFIASAE